MALDAGQKKCIHIWVNVPNFAIFCQKCHALAQEVEDDSGAVKTPERPHEAYDRAMGIIK